MNRTQAQFILGACPPGPLPVGDPQVIEALALAEADAGLARWLAETRSFDAAAAAKLRTVEPPADLKDAILAGRRRLAPIPIPVAPPQRAWRRPTWLALAAMLMVAGLAAFWGRSGSRTGSPVADAGPGETRADADSFRLAAAKFLSEQWQHDFDYPESSFPKIQQWAAQQPDQARLEVPAELAGSRTYGCKVFQWRGHRATLVCFIARDEGQIIHIVSVDRSALPDAAKSASDDAPQFAPAGAWNTAVWSRGSRRYVALTTADTQTLARYVRPAGSAAL